MSAASSRSVTGGRSFSGDGQRHHKSHDLLRWALAIGTLINHEYRQGPPTISQVDDPHDVPDASGGRHRAPGVQRLQRGARRAGHLGQAWRFAFEILTLVGGLEA